MGLVVPCFETYKPSQSTDSMHSSPAGVNSLRWVLTKPNSLNVMDPILKAFGPISSSGRTQNVSSTATRWLIPSIIWKLEYQALKVSFPSKKIECLIFFFFECLI